MMKIFLPIVFLFLSCCGNEVVNVYELRCPQDVRDRISNSFDIIEIKAMLENQLVLLKTKDGYVYSDFKNCRVFDYENWRCDLKDGLSYNLHTTYEDEDLPMLDFQMSNGNISPRMFRKRGDWILYLTKFEYYYFYLQNWLRNLYAPTYEAISDFCDKKLDMYKIIRR